jgi:uncharacterized membrane protein
MLYLIIEEGLVVYGLENIPIKFNSFEMFITVKSIFSAIYAFLIFSTVFLSLNYNNRDPKAVGRFYLISTILGLFVLAFFLFIMINLIISMATSPVDTATFTVYQ